MVRDAVEVPVVGVSKDEVIQALYEMKTGKAPVTSGVSLKVIAASRKEGTRVMIEICQSILD